MKKTMAILLITCLLMVSATGCSKKLNGTYNLYGSDVGSVTFKGDDITISAFGINITGTYEIKGDKLKVVAEFLGQEIPYDYQFKQDGDSIYLDGIEFRKE